MHNDTKLQHGFLLPHLAIHPYISCRKDIANSQLVPDYVHMWFVHSTNPALFIAHSFGTEKCIQCHQTLSL